MPYNLFLTTQDRRRSMNNATTLIIFYNTQIMKKKITTSLLGLLICIAAQSQVDRHALGLRIGGGESFGAEVSYQHGLSRLNRLEADLGVGGNSHYTRIGLTGTYQWVWNIGAEGLNWYVGPGAGISINDGKKHRDDYVGVAVGGQIGLGFNFKIPLQLTVDVRPMWNFISDDDDDDFGWGLALGVRYRF